MIRAILALLLRCVGLELVPAAEVAASKRKMCFYLGGDYVCRKVK